jgi:hypothetical protein
MSITYFKLIYVDKARRTIPIARAPTTDPTTAPTMVPADDEFEDEINEFDEVAHGSLEIVDVLPSAATVRLWTK